MPGRVAVEIEIKINFVVPGFYLLLDKQMTEEGKTASNFRWFVYVICVILFVKFCNFTSSLVS